MIKYKLFEKMDSDVIEEIMDKYKNDRVVSVTKSSDITEHDNIYHSEKGEGVVVGFGDKGRSIKIKFGDDIEIFFLKYLIDNEKIIKIIKSSDEYQDNELEEEEEEEDDDDDDDYIDDISLSDLLEYNVSHFLTEDELTLTSTIDDVLKFKKQIEQDNLSNPFKKKLHKRRLESIDILENVFQLMITRFPGKDVMRFTGEIPYEELWVIRQKENIHYPKAKFSNITMIYWIFKDVVLFKIR